MRKSLAALFTLLCALVSCNTEGEAFLLHGGPRSAVPCPFPATEFIDGCAASHTYIANPSMQRANMYGAIGVRGSGYGNASGGFYFAQRPLQNNAGVDYAVGAAADLYQCNAATCGSNHAVMDANYVPTGFQAQGCGPVENGNDGSGFAKIECSTDSGGFTNLVWTNVDFRGVQVLYDHLNGHSITCVNCIFGGGPNTFSWQNIWSDRNSHKSGPIICHNCSLDGGSLELVNYQISHGTCSGYSTTKPTSVTGNSNSCFNVNDNGSNFFSFSGTAVSDNLFFDYTAFLNMPSRAVGNGTPGTTNFLYSYVEAGTGLTAHGEFSLAGGHIFALSNGTITINPGGDDTISPIPPSFFASGSPTQTTFWPCDFASPGALCATGGATLPIPPIPGTTTSALPLWDFQTGAWVTSIDTVNNRYTYSLIAPTGPNKQSTPNALYNIPVTFGGTAYPPSPTFTFTGGVCTTEPVASTPFNWVQAGVIVHVQISNPGANCTSPPTMTVSAPGVASVPVAAGGNSYTGGTITFSGGVGSGAAATPVFSGGVLTGVTMTAFGSYTVAPNATFNGVGGTGASLGTPVLGTPATFGTLALNTAPLEIRYGTTIPTYNFEYSTMYSGSQQAAGGNTSFITPLEISGNAGNIGSFDTMSLIGNAFLSDKLSNVVGFYPVNGSPALTTATFTLTQCSQNYIFDPNCMVHLGTSTFTVSPTGNCSLANLTAPFTSILSAATVDLTFQNIAACLNMIVGDPIISNYKWWDWESTLNGIGPANIVMSSTWTSNNIFANHLNLASHIYENGGTYTFNFNMQHNFFAAYGVAGCTLYQPEQWSTVPAVAGLDTSLNWSISGNINLLQTTGSSDPGINPTHPTGYPTSPGCQQTN